MRRAIFTGLAKIAAWIAGLYAIVIVTMFFAQTWLTFPAYLVPDARPALPSDARRLDLPTADGERLHGIWLPSSRPEAADKVIVLAFGGNGWHVEGLALDMRRHFPDPEVVAFSYRGYRPSSGSPSAAALLADAVLIHDHVQGKFGPAHVIAVGYSLGSGIAAYVARERPLAGLILVTPYDALEAVAQQHYPWAPVRWLFRHAIPAADFLRGLTIPIAVIAAERDVVVPPARTAALREAIAKPILDRTIAGAQHHDIFASEEFADAMATAMAAIVASAASAKAANGSNALR